MSGRIFLLPVCRETMFGDSRRTVVVVGAQWGDEGKGKLVDVLAERAAWVVRYQGGANAGHTVDIAGSKFVLHQIPSGILHPGVRCAIGNGVVLDPDTLFEEIDGLVRDGIDVEGRLYVSDRTHLVLPYHKLVDAESAASKVIGTTGRGIGPAYEDKVARRGVRVLDLRNRDRLEKLVTQGTEHAIAQLRRFGSKKLVRVDETLEMLASLEKRLLPLAEDVGLVIHRALKSGAAILLEGAQGSLLDVDHGTYPFVTSSNCVAANAAVGSGIGPTLIDKVMGISKAYTTRVGGGPFPTELTDAIGDRLRKAGDEYGATTGRPRRCGWLDAVVLRYAVRVNGLWGLAVTKLDVLSGLEQLHICTAYELDGKRITELPTDFEDLGRVKPVYETLPGWDVPLAGVRTMEELPSQALAYVRRVQEVSGVPVVCVSVGADRGETILLQNPFRAD
jgi:adenylosuccinate synthase